MNLKNVGAAFGRKTRYAAAVAGALMANAASAGAIADAVTAATDGVKADLYQVGTIALSLTLIAVVFAMGKKMFGR